MNRRPEYSKEVRERAVRLVLTGEHDHSSRWAAIQSVASKIGCTPETLRSWVITLCRKSDASGRRTIATMARVRCGSS